MTYQPATGNRHCLLPTACRLLASKLPARAKVAPKTPAEVYSDRNFREKFMSRILRAGLVMLLLALAVSAKENAETAIRGVLEAQTAAWNRGDIEGFMAGYWRSEETVFISGDSVTRGWQATLDRYKKGYDTRDKMGALTFSDLDIKKIDKKNAVVIGRWALARANDNPRGRFTLLFRKFKEGWRVVHDHTSSA
jgi:ketosteroid isomerase-like protein